MAELNLQVRLRAFDQMSRTFANVGRAGQRLLRQFDQNRNTLRRFDAQLRDIANYLIFFIRINARLAAFTQYSGKICMKN